MCRSSKEHTRSFWPISSEYVNQLPDYMKAEKADYGIFMIIKEDDSHDNAIQSVFERQEKIKNELGQSLPVMVVDARTKTSASKK